MNNLEMKIIFVMSQVIHAEDDIETVVDKIRRVQHALEEMERREEEFKVLHERDQQMREEQATKRKEDMEQQIKGTILSSNRLFMIYISLLMLPRNSQILFHLNFFNFSHIEFESFSNN